MTLTEKALIDTVAELYVAVNGLHYHLSAEPRNAEAGGVEALSGRADALTPCEQTLASVRRRLRELGADI
jgi:hypothetical protein